MMQIDGTIRWTSGQVPGWIVIVKGKPYGQYVELTHAGHMLVAALNAEVQNSQPVSALVEDRMLSRMAEEFGRDE